MWTEWDYQDLVLLVTDDSEKAAELLDLSLWPQHLGGLAWLSDVRVPESYYLPHIIQVWDEPQPKPSVN